MLRPNLAELSIGYLGRCGLISTLEAPGRSTHCRCAPRSAVAAMFSDFRVRGRRVRYIQTRPLSTKWPCRTLPKCDNAAVVQTHSGGANENRTSQVFRPGR